MRSIQNVLRDTVKVYRTAQFQDSSVVLYKIPGTPKVRSTYTVETVNLKGRTIERQTFRHIKRVDDAEKMFHYLVSLAYQNEVA